MTCTPAPRLVRVAGPGRRDTIGAAPTTAGPEREDGVPRESGTRSQREGGVGPAAVDVTGRAFYEAHYHRLAGWTRTLVDDDETAHDIAEAFTRLITKHRHIDDARGYLYTIAVNLVRDHWRRTRRERRRFREIVALRPVHTTAPPATTSAVRLLVDALPDRLRAPVLLHYYADMPLADVAHHLGRNPNTVKSDLFKARAALRKNLTGVPVEDWQ